MCWEVKHWSSNYNVKQPNIHTYARVLRRMASFCSEESQFHVVPHLVRLSSLGKVLLDRNIPNRYNNVLVSEPKVSLSVRKSFCDCPKCLQSVNMCLLSVHKCHKTKHEFFNGLSLYDHSRIIF